MKMCDGQSADFDVDLVAINQYFKSVVDLVPAEFYFKADTKEKQPKKRNRGKKSGKDGELGSRAKNALAKRKKFETKNMKTTSERITEARNDCDDDVPMKKLKIRDDGEAPTINALQRRLKEKIAEIQQKRNPKNRSEEEVLRIRERRRKERKKFKLKKKMGLSNASAELQGLPGQRNAKIDSKIQSQPTKTTEPILNSDGKVVFSKFDFGQEPGKKQQKRKRKEDVLTGKNLKTLLVKAESKKDELKTLKETNPDEAASVELKESWNKALAKAGGTKVKDDPELLKKSLKKEKAIKKQHAKKWKERESNVMEKMQKKQERRKRNIQARKDQMKEKKMNKRMKRFAKSVPGF